MTTCAGFDIQLRTSLVAVTPQCGIYWIVGHTGACLTMFGSRPVSLEVSCAWRLDDDQN